MSVSDRDHLLDCMLEHISKSAVHEMTPNPKALLRIAEMLAEEFPGEEGPLNGMLHLLLSASMLCKRTPERILAHFNKALHASPSYREFRELWDQHIRQAEERRSQAPARPQARGEEVPN